MKRNSEAIFFTEAAIRNLEAAQNQGRIQAIFRQFRRFHVNETPEYHSKVDLLQFLVTKLASLGMFEYCEITDQNCMRVLFQIEQLNLET